MTVRTCDKCGTEGQKGKKNMKLYRVQFIAFDAECTRKSTLMMVMVEAPCHVEAYVSAAHTYRLACPESLKNMDPSMYIEEVSNEEDIWDE